MMKIEKGMYVRTRQGIGYIDDIVKYRDEHDIFHLDINKGSIHNIYNDTYWNDEKDLLKEPSFDLMDLIEAGDIINGSKLLSIDYAYDVDHNCDKLHYYYEFDNVDKDINEYYDKLIIEEIITKEQYEANVYKVNRNEN